MPNIVVYLIFTGLILSAFVFTYLIKSMVKTNKEQLDNYNVEEDELCSIIQYEEEFEYVPNVFTSVEIFKHRDEHKYLSKKNKPSIIKPLHQIGIEKYTNKVAINGIY